MFFDFVRQNFVFRKNASHKKYSKYFSLFFLLFQKNPKLFCLVFWFFSYKQKEWNWTHVEGYYCLPFSTENHYSFIALIQVFFLSPFLCARDFLRLKEILLLRELRHFRNTNVFDSLLISFPQKSSVKTCIMLSDFSSYKTSCEDTFLSTTKVFLTSNKNLQFLLKICWFLLRSFSKRISRASGQLSTILIFIWFPIVCQLFVLIRSVFKCPRINGLDQLIA